MIAIDPGMLYMEAFQQLITIKFKVGHIQVIRMYISGGKCVFTKKCWIIEGEWFTGGKEIGGISRNNDYMLKYSFKRLVINA